MKMYNKQKELIEKLAANMIVVRTRNNDVTETVTVSHNKLGLVLLWTMDHGEKGYWTIDKDLLTPIVFTKSLSMLAAAFLADLDQLVADFCGKDRKDLKHTNEEFEYCWEDALAATGAAGFHWQ